MSTVSTNTPADNILTVNDLRVEFDTYGGIVKAVRGVEFSVRRGKTLAIVGESGCGKSVTVQALMGLIPMPPGRVTSGSVKLNGKEILGIPTKQANQVRGRQIGMIFQDPMSSLNPTMTIGKQIAETLRIHEGLSYKDGRKRAIELLEQVQIPEAEKRIDSYPFQYSGGMRQRVMIAMSIACNPSVLIADEPTTALDVTIQAQILSLLKELQRKRDMSIILITHDLGVVARMADEVAVMYAGQIVERGTSEQVFYHSAHPYTVGLKSAMPEKSATLAAGKTMGGKRDRLVPIDGAPPDLFHPPKGCAYFDRCPYAMKLCEGENPALWEMEADHLARCWLHHEKAASRTDAVFRSRTMKPEMKITTEVRS